MIRAWLAVLAIAAGGCGSGSHHQPGRDAAPVTPRSDDAVVPLARAPLGALRLEAFAWRSRSGEDDYKQAVAAEKTADWAAVVAACRRARALDPEHLEAAWLEAAGLARQGAMDQVLAPLQVAAAGDWGKWGERSLELDVFTGFLATPAGRAWARAAEDYRADHAAALARSVILGARGDLYAYDPRDQRWLRVTRTYGAVRAAVGADSAHLVAYVAVRKADKGKAVTVGVIDLATGRPGREVALVGDTVKLRFRDAKGGPALEVADGKPGKWDRIDWRRGTRAATDAKGALLSPTLILAGDKARLSRLPSKDVTADWEEDGVAGALRIERSRRTVTAPGTTLFDGNTLVWSRDQQRLAVVTAPAEPCAEEDREVVIIDAGSGTLRSVDRGKPPAQVAWLADGMLAIGRGGAVTLHAADGTPGTPLASDAPLWLWTRPVDPECNGQPPGPEPDPLPPEEPVDPDTEGGTAQGAMRVPDGGSDASVVVPPDAGR